MMPAHPIWIEIFAVPGTVAHRVRLTGESFLIGRGYQCDLIVDDAAVSPQHLRIARDDVGAWWIEDLASENGTINLADGTQCTRLPLGDSADVLLGGTRLAVRTAHAAVAPTLRLADPVTPMATPQSVSLPRNVIKAALLSLVLVAIASAISVWIKQTSESKITHYIVGVIAIPLVICVWAGAWALVTRIVSAEGKFFRHLFITCVAVLISTAVSVFFTYLDYAFAFVGKNSWESMSQWIVMGGLLVMHLRLVAPKRFLISAGIVSTLVVGAIAVEAMYSGERGRNQPPTIVVTLLPTFFPTKTAVTSKELFERVNALKAELEEERKKDPPPSASVGADFD